VFSHFTAAPYSIDEEAQRRRREGFYRYLLGLLSKPAKGKRLLDIGCAFGHFLDCAAAEGYTPFGTEVSEEMADLSRRRRAYPVSTRPLDDLRLPETTFDVITFVDTFYYFEDPMRVLEQCRALLAPGGELLMRVVNRNHLARLHHLMLRARLNREVLPEMPFSATDDAISCHSRRSLLTLMRRTGYQVKMLTGIELGKKDKSLALRAFYGVTQALAWVTAEHLAWTPGLICLATAG
jgi:2-polyprenyl-3-methyl-5-hydroxy-6-metoxy-1,4-benzoquinol methylase